MKKIYYIITFITLAFASCKPLTNIYNEMDARPSAQTIKTYTATAYASFDAAKATTGIPTLLNTKFGDYPEGTSAIVTFPLTVGGSPLVADNLLSRIAYTMLPADYTFTGNTSAFLTSVTAINYLNYKYPTPPINQLVVLTYQYVETNATPATGITVTDSFLYLNGLWTKIYTISPAQYASVGRGSNNYFFAADLPNLVSYFNSFLLNDPAVVATAKTGDVKYVSYKYTATLQQVFPLMFDGTNWVNKSSLNFLKFNGTFIPDPTIFVIIPVGANNPDYIWLRDNTTIGQATARANVVSFGDFNTSLNTSTTTWTDAEVTAAMAAILLHKIPTPVVGIPYKITYYIFPGANPVIAASKTYKFDGTAFVFQF